MFPAAIPVVFAQAMGGSLGTNLLFFGALFAIMYFVLIRPQQKQMKEQQAMLSSLKKGDDVVTQGGLLGKIFAVQDKVVTLEVSSGVKLRVLKSSIQAKVTVADEPAKAADGDAKKEEK
jgi:preprotein translocase subunit YajC